MSLSLVKPQTNPSLGVVGVDVKPITEGTKMTVIKQQDDTQTSSFWGFLDDIGTSIGQGLSQYADMTVKKELNDFVGGSETTVDSRGNPADQPGGEKVNTVGQVPFYRAYQKELMIGGGILVAGTLLYFAVRGKK